MNALGRVTPPAPRYEVLLRDGNSVRECEQNNDRRRAFQRFQEFVSSGLGTEALLWDTHTNEYLACAEWSAAVGKESVS